MAHIAHTPRLPSPAQGTRRGVRAPGALSARQHGSSHSHMMRTNGRSAFLQGAQSLSSSSDGYYTVLVEVVQPACGSFDKLYRFKSLVTIVCFVYISCHQGFRRFEAV